MPATEGEECETTIAQHWCCKRALRIEPNLTEPWDHARRAYAWRSRDGIAGCLWRRLAAGSPRWVITTELVVSITSPLPGASRPIRCWLGSLSLTRDARVAKGFGHDLPSPFYRMLHKRFVRAEL